MGADGGEAVSACENSPPRYAGVRHPATTRTRARVGTIALMYVTGATPRDFLTRSERDTVEARPRDGCVLSATRGRAGARPRRARTATIDAHDRDRLDGPLHRSPGPRRSRLTRRGCGPRRPRTRNGGTADP